VANQTAHGSADKARKHAKLVLIADFARATEHTASAAAAERASDLLKHAVLARSSIRDQNEETA
jgi:hypothetical protein